jgi:hypothetical protein
MFEMVFKRESASATPNDQVALPSTQLSRRRRSRQSEQRVNRRRATRALSCRCASSRCPPLCYLVVPCV